MKCFLLSWLLIWVLDCQANSDGNTGTGHEPPAITLVSAGPLSKDPQDHLATLLDRYETWQGTPHKVGGLDRSGIDCSGFVVLTFADEFGIKLPRSSNKQANIGREIPESTLNTGDLVFFKIPNQKRYYHVGIYLENQKFLHASSSKGVTISDLKDRYWQDSFWKSIRVLK